MSAATAPLSRIADRLTPTLAFAALKAMALACRVRAELRASLFAVEPSGRSQPLTASYAFQTRDAHSRVWARIADGRLTVGTGALDSPDVTVTFRNAAYLRGFFLGSADTDLFGWLLDNHMSFDGNLAVLAKFGHLAAAVRLGAKQAERPAGRRWPTDTTASWQDRPPRRTGEQRPFGAPTGSSWLQDPALPDLTIDDFPLLKRKLHEHLHTRPRICTERALRYTEAWLRERDRTEPAPPALRQARIFAHIMRSKRAIVGADDLLLGTTTSHPVGVQLFPELGATAIWPELLTMQARELNPYEITDDDVRLLDQRVFPFWLRDNIREWARRQFDHPASLQLDERWVLYFLWKNHAISHTIADMPAVLSRGMTSIAKEARELAAGCTEPVKRAFYEAVDLSLQAVVDYAKRLADEAERLAEHTRDPAARKRLLEGARAARRCPAQPARTLLEALQGVWITFLALHQESMNAGLSIGRLDAWLQPFFELEMQSATAPEDREAIVLRTLELVCAFMLKATDHLPLVADIGNRLFGGSSSDQVITVGGVLADGSSAVCDMTWFFLKATEMLALRDPNMNARFSPEANPDFYLRRLCEVNAITRATPSIHNDHAVLAALQRQGFPIEAARDWAATGCVEPTVCGAHMGHTNCMMFNMVAPLETTLHRGVHPLVGERVGPATDDPCTMESFDEFLAAYKAQLAALLDSAIDGNNLLGRAHQALHPTPYLSSLIQGSLAAGRDVVDGGATFNSSGIAMVGLADVVDSLAVVRALVFERRRYTMSQLLQAVDDDFAGHDKLLAEVQRRVPKFGSAAPEPARIANDLVQWVFGHVTARANYRGGHYVPGYWSMSNHVAFGLLSGALPSGRKRGKAFTPGLTPSPDAQADLLQNIRQVASLDPELLPNNIAFNVKIAPGGADDLRQVVDRMTAYARAYVELGGMQLQFNVVSSETLRAAMANPEQYRDLLVRISGYNAYFVELNRDMQLELIERAEHS